MGRHSNVLMRLTLLVRSDESGLGYQTRSYYKHLKPHKTVLIDISNLNGNKQHYDWYDYDMVIKGLPNKLDAERILEDTDVLLTAETPYYMDLYTLARQKGVKTVSVENPEFYDGIIYPQYELPDVIILPSVWLMDKIKAHAEPKGTKVVQLHHPVDRDEIPFRLRTNIKPLHIAGKPAAYDRNGTQDFMQACPNGTVTTQNEQLAVQIRKQYRHSRVLTGIYDQRELYGCGDILVFPRRYGGNCLPLNEALASGMPVIMPDISPNNHLLPKKWLVSATVREYFTPRTRVDVYQVNPAELAEKISYFTKDNIQAESRKADEIADSISWERLKDKWMDVLYSQ